MGGRWMLTTIQVTFIIRGELGEDDVNKFIELLRSNTKDWQGVIDVLLDETQTKDVEV